MQKNVAWRAARASRTRGACDCALTGAVKPGSMDYGVPWRISLPHPSVRTADHSASWWKAANRRVRAAPGRIAQIPPTHATHTHASLHHATTYHDATSACHTRPPTTHSPLTSSEGRARQRKGGRRPGGKRTLW